MRFHVFRDRQEPDTFFVTDEGHDTELHQRLTLPADRLETIGVFDEMGEARAAFNEALAKDAIKKMGYYRFVSKTYDPVAQAPIAMP